MKNLLFFLMLAVILCNCKHPKMVIEPIKIMDTTINFYYKSHFYLLKNYEDNIENEHIIENYIKENMDKNFESYEYYDLIFYKESDETNKENITKYVKAKGRFYQDMDDYIYNYRWIKGYQVRRTKFKDGHIIE